MHLSKHKTTEEIFKLFRLISKEKHKSVRARGPLIMDKRKKNYYLEKKKILRNQH